MKISRIFVLICIAFCLSFGLTTAQQSTPSQEPEIYVNPDWDEIAKNLEEANKASEAELEELRKRYDLNSTPEEEPVPQEVLDMLKSYESLLNLSKQLEQVKDFNNQKEISSDEYDFDYDKIAEDVAAAEEASKDEWQSVVDKYQPNKSISPPSLPVPQEILDIFDSYQNLLDATKEIENIRDNSVNVNAVGTGQTTGHIADLNVINNTDYPIEITPERFYIAANDRYQAYVGRVSPGHTVPPGATMAIPVEGYCADVHSPPVPMGDPMPPLDTWITVSDTGSPDIVSGAPQVPEPMNPPGANDSEPEHPPTEGVPVKLLPRDPVSPFTPELIPEIIITPRDRPDDAIIVTYPGTDTPIDGTIDPESNPPVYGTILVEVVEKLEDAYDVIRESENFPTPYFADGEREKESVIQQAFWVYTAAITGDEYEKDDFETKVYDQFEATTGKSVDALPEEQKEQVDTGIEDFWNTFQATGVLAKVISLDSPNLIDPDMILATVRMPRCECNDISYDLEVKRGDDVVHTGSHTSKKSPAAKIRDFEYGDVLEIKISNISANCDCDDAECEFYPAESTNSNSPGYTEPDTTRPGEVDIDMDNDPAGEIGSKGNNNCQNKDKTWNDDSTEYSFTLETKNENTTNKSVFQRLRIKSYCQLEDCGKKLCAKTIQLNFVTAK